MKNNIRIINFLRIFFKIFYKLSIFAFVGWGLVYFVHLFIDFRVPDIPFAGETYFKTDVAYDLILGSHYDETIDVAVNLGRIHSNDLFYRFMGLLNAVLSAGILTLMFRYAYYIFNELHKREKNGTYFSLEVYHWIRKVGFLMLAYPIYFLINGCVFSWFLLDNVSFMGQEVHFQPDYTLLTKVVSVLVVFVFAEIYRVGIEMKEETDLTI
ncbi:DUF2975 domain-containing protein [Ancylomarina euxinus]|uniref:DUF2975 domain-containing protein n=1 Tax=Ancylomarina euxinus TaxID=2283627 RepID=A0A425Y5D9_9BACT|nr:DUF2975 domain-containing protein [Ancylomarina euxinus]MCZ4694261.1 DUF2975 domain-containing protein [Ancylomarina euxinus]MUP14407.1 DUF2975 domain-containing protein [Ancylomarina euxinus]RRG23716.1 DUF2975 domain-containing protein [Ancylomarina euxinus]